MQNWLQKENVSPYVKLLYRILLTVLVVLVLAQLIPLVLTFFLPFILAFIVASAMNPLINLLQKKFKVPRGALSVLMVLVTLLGILAIVGWFVYALVRELVTLAQDIDGVIEYFNQMVQVLSIPLYWLTEFIPADAEEMLSGMLDGLTLWIQSAGTAFADTIVIHTVSVTTRVGEGVIATVIFIMSSYFMMADYPRLSQKMQKLFSPKAYKGYATLKDATLTALGRYLRAQLLMAFFIFLFSLIGLLIIGQEFALLLALLLGVLDFLPLVGSGAVLVPWGIVTLLSGSIGRGIYLLAMSLALFLLRRVIEPKVVGSQMGLSPLTALASIYIGMRLGGILGLILGPIVAMIFISIYKAGLLNGWIKDINAVLNLRKHSEPPVDEDFS